MRNLVERYNCNEQRKNKSEQRKTGCSFLMSRRRGIEKFEK